MELIESGKLALRSRLLALRDQIHKEEFYQGCNRRAIELVEKDPFAFLIACCLDRGSPSELIWSIPLWLKELLGDLDPYKIANMDVEELQEVIEHLPKKPYYKNAAQETIKCLAHLIVHDFDGDPQALWRECSSREIVKNLGRVFGVGPGIANLTVHQIKRVFAEDCPHLDPEELDIKADVHTRRVLYRLGVAEGQTDSQAIRAARDLYPGRPGALDPVLWYIGRNWCRNTNPKCEQCPVGDLCRKQGLESGAS